MRLGMAEGQAIDNPLSVGVLIGGTVPLEEIQSHQSVGPGGNALNLFIHIGVGVVHFVHAKLTHVPFYNGAG